MKTRHTNIYTNNFDGCVVRAVSMDALENVLRLTMRLVCGRRA